MGNTLKADYIEEDLDFPLPSLVQYCYEIPTSGLSVGLMICVVELLADV